MTAPCKYYFINGVVVTYVEYMEWLKDMREE